MFRLGRTDSSKCSGADRCECWCLRNPTPETCELRNDNGVDLYKIIPGNSIVFTHQSRCSVVSTWSLILLCPIYLRYSCQIFPFTTKIQPFLSYEYEAVPQLIRVWRGDFCPYCAENKVLYHFGMVCESMLYSCFNLL